MQLSQLATKGKGAASTREAGIECGQGGCSQIITHGSDGFPVVKVKTTDYVEGGLLIEVVKPITIQLLWSAFNLGAVHEGDGSQARLDVIARDTLAQLPEYYPGN